MRSTKAAKMTDGDHAMPSFAAENLCEQQGPRERWLKSGPDVRSDTRFATMLNAAAFESVATHR